MELILHVARAEKRQPELAKRLRARRKLIADIVVTTMSETAKGRVGDPVWPARCCSHWRMASASTG